MISKTQAFATLSRLESKFSQYKIEKEQALTESSRLRSELSEASEQHMLLRYSVRLADSKIYSLTIDLKRSNDECMSVKQALTEAQNALK